MRKRTGIAQLVGLATTLALAPAGARAESPGGLDSSFSGDGRAYSGFDVVSLYRDSGRDVLVEPDGHIVVVGRVEAGSAGAFDLGITRFRPDGGIDTTWGDSNGRTTINLGGSNEAAAAVVMDSFGGYIVAGWTGDATSTDFLVVRVDAQGHRDYTWGADGGKVIANFDFAPPNYPFDYATSIAVLPDGKILVAGTGDASNAQGDNADPALLRLLPNGARDPGFGSVVYGGVGQCLHDRPLSDGFLVDDVAVQPDGAIVLVGYTRDNTLGDFSIGVKRLTSGCVNDSSFYNFGGQRRIDFEPGSSPELAHAVALQPDGRIVVVGSAYVSAAGDDDIAVLRLESDGNFDTSFGGDGTGWRRVALDLGGGRNDRGYDVAIQGDGKIVIVGSTDTATSGHQDFAIVRLLPNGTPDPSFGLFSVSPVDFGGGGSNDDAAFGVALAPDGRIVAAGEAVRSAGGDLDFAVARLQNDYIFADGFESGSLAAWSQP